MSRKSPCLIPPPQLELSSCAHIVRIDAIAIPRLLGECCCSSFLWPLPKFVPKPSDLYWHKCTGINQLSCPVILFRPSYQTKYAVEESKRIGRESNPGRPRGRRAFYHRTTDTRGRERTILHVTIPAPRLALANATILCRNYRLVLIYSCLNRA